MGLIFMVYGNLQFVLLLFCFDNPYFPQNLTSMHNDVIGLMPEMDSGLSSFKMAEGLF